MKISVILSFIPLLWGAKGFLVVVPSGPRASWDRGAVSNTRLGYIDDESKMSEALSLGLHPMRDASELRIRQHYDAWRCKFGKPANESRYLIFKHHFLEQQAWNERNGENHELNEFGDVSEVEYLQLLQGFVVEPTMTSDNAILEPPMQGRYLETAPTIQNQQTQYLCALGSVDGQKQQHEGMWFVQFRVNFGKEFRERCLQNLKEWHLVQRNKNW